MDMDYDLESQYEDRNGGAVDYPDTTPDYEFNNFDQVDGDWDTDYDNGQYEYPVMEEYEPNPYDGTYSEM